MAFHILLLLTAFTTVYAGSENPQPPNAQARQFTYTSQYPVDLQYDFSLLDPQLQYPQFSGEPSRVQPQVFIYPSGASGQPFLLQPGAPPGNFLIPQPQPGFVLRDAPAGRPSVFGYPKPAYVPPINKDAEEIPINSGGFQPISPTVGKPEKLETFDEKPELERPVAGEADVLASADRTLGGNPSLKPGHRFFILNGQPLFSNYPLPQFPNSPYQPSEDKFAPENTQFFTFRQNGPSFLPNGFSKPQVSDTPLYRVPIDNFFTRNSVTGQINSAKQHNYENPSNEITHSQNYVSLNQRDQPTPHILLKNLPILPYKNEKNEQIPELRINTNENLNTKNQYSNFKIKPIEIPNTDDDLLNNKFKNLKEDKESITISAKPGPTKESAQTESTLSDKSQDPSISRSQPSALALAGPGGVAAAAPRATALTGEKGLSVSSPQATAIAGPTRDQVKEKPKNRKEKQ